MRRTLAALGAAALLSAPMAAMPSQANAQPTVVIGDGFVNVQIVDVEVLRNVTIAAAVQAVANVCPGIDVTALATAVDQTGGRQQIDCDADGDTDVVIFQNQRPRR
jgi:hypothetical protein